MIGILRAAGMTTAVLAGAFAATTPANAAATVLDFAGNICGVAGNLTCGNGSQIGQNYGDTAGQVDVSYRAANATTGVTTEAYLKTWQSGYGDLTRVVWGGANEIGFFSEITLTALAGYEVSLRSFDFGCYQNRVSCRTMNYTIINGASAIGGGSASSGFPGHGSLSPNTAYYTSPIVLRWGPDGYDVGLDNITFDVRAVSAGAVPEPASWALMIFGFGIAGAAMRRRNTTAHVFA